MAQGRPITLDGWKSLMSGLGGSHDKTTHLSASATVYLPDIELHSMYTGDGTSATIIDVVADDMTREGWEVPQDTDAALQKAQKALKVPQAINKALKWKRLYGGAIIVMDYANAGRLETPLNINSKKAPILRGLKVYAAPRIDLRDTDLNQDPESPYFEDVESFRIRKRLGGVDFMVHRSRCIVLKGKEIPDIMMDTGTVAQRYWGLSELQQGYDLLKIFGAFVQGIGVLGEEFSVAKLRLSNLEQLVAEGDFTSIRKRMEIIAESKSLINAVLLGDSEEYSRDNIPFTGIPDVLDRFMMLVSGAFQIPVTKLFGRAAAGMNATGENDMRNYYDSIVSAQDQELEPVLYPILQAINMGMGSPIPPEELSVKFNPVWAPTQAEETKMRKDQSDTDATYIDKGVLTPDEVRQARFAGEYSYETTVEGEAEITGNLTGDDLKAMGR